MSLAIGHFSLGAGLTGAILLATRLNKKIRNNERIMFGGGIWGIVPDIEKLIPLLKILHRSWWTDIFWFHRLIDLKIDPTDNYWISAYFIAFMLGILVIFWSIDQRKGQN